MRPMPHVVMLHRRRSTCRACGGTNLKQFLSLGPTPLANAFLKSPDDFSAEQSFPLDVFFCETCSLVQLLDVIDPGILFDNYIYRTGTSDTVAAHNRAYAATVVDLLGLTQTDLVVEVASNDGSLLRCFADQGVRCLGIEPATNIADIAVARNVNTVNTFFNAATARDLRGSHGSARAVIGNNVLAHVDDPLDFLRGCAQLIRPDGTVIIEVPYVKEMLEQLEYDTIYHEHLCYFSITALSRLFDSAGLAITQIDRISLHGGSLRVYARMARRGSDHANEVKTWSDEEKRAGLLDSARYEQFAREVAENRRALRALLLALKAEGKTIGGYGAPAKGNTLLNYCNIDTDLLPFIVDKAPMKVGLYTPGTHIPVFAIEELVHRQPDYTVILAWNFAAEIIRQQGTYRQKNGKFIVPIPEPTIVSEEAVLATR